MPTVATALRADQEKFARVGAGSHCTVLKGDCVTPEQISAARNHLARNQEFQDIPVMQELAILINNLQS